MIGRAARLASLTVAGAWEGAARFMGQAGLEEPRREAAMLLSHLLGTEPTGLWLHMDEPVAPETEQALEALCARRAGGEPAAYLTGRKGFWTLDLEVDRRVLIPRPETEHLVEVALERCARPRPRVLDVGMGSGCIGLAFASERPGAFVLGIDVSSGALQVAAANSRRLGLSRQIALLQARSLTSVGGDGTWDVVASNPPYVPSREVPRLMRDVRDHEPLTALTPGADGLEVTRHVVAGATRLLADGGCLAVEIDPRQAAQVLGLLVDPAWAQVAVRPDLSGTPRVVSAILRR